MERSCEPMNKNRIKGADEQGERSRNRKALVIKAKRRRSGGCAVKECVLTWGRSRLMSERATMMNRSEKSAEAVLAADKERRAERGEVSEAMTMQQARRQMFAKAERAGVAHGEAMRDPVSDEASCPRHDTGSTGSALLMAALTREPATRSLGSTPSLITSTS